MREEGLDPRDVRIFSGSSHPELAQDIANHLGVPLDPTRISRFSNDNLYIQLGASVRSRKVFIVQSLSPPVNDHLMELFMMIDIARGASAKEIHAIIPYYSFARSDKKDAPRISITAKLVADLLQKSGATHMMTMVLHSPQVHGFFGIPADPLSSRPVFKSHLLKKDLSDTIMIAPDIGHAKATARLADSLDLPMAAANKERVSDHEVRIGRTIGAQVQGKRQAIIYDDEVSTGGSVLELTKHLVEAGVQEIVVACTHGVFVRDALSRLSAVPEIKEVIATDTVCLPEADRPPKLTVLSVGEIFGEAIRHNYLRESIGDLFVYSDQKG